ncbi:alpha/beta fold hydrolase [Kocuria sabuli]|uniref:alpha/beta fold hydrolase n=1 Tax=Kocuria sabuli TaxID=3071448 RepID=UPI0034D61928
MITHRHPDQLSAGTAANLGPQRSTRPWWRRLGRLVGIVRLVLVALLAVSTIVNFAMVRYERATTEPYGQRNPVEGGSVNVVDHEAEGPTIVLLSGLGTPAPALDFAPLVRELTGYRVVVVEGLGYSDMQGPQLTAQNVSQEVHTALAAAGIEQPYVLGGHSLAGFHILDYVNRYPGEVSAVTDEWHRAGDNARRLQDMTLPADLPVPAFVAQDTMDQTPQWLPLHEEQLQQVREHQIIVLQGGHYLHWTHSPEMATRTTAFLQEHGIAPRGTSGPGTNAQRAPSTAIPLPEWAAELAR